MVEQFFKQLGQIHVKVFLTNDFNFNNKVFGAFVGKGGFKWSICYYSFMKPQELEGWFLGHIWFPAPMSQ